MSQDSRSRGEPVPSAKSPGQENLDQLEEGLQQIAREHGRMKDLLDAVLLISRELELDLVLHKIIDTARQLVDARYAALGVLGDDGEFSVITSGAGTGVSAGTDPTARPGGGALLQGTALLGALAREPRPVHLEAPTDHPRATGFPEGDPGSLLVPIRASSTVYGNLYLADKTGGGAFTDDDEAAVTALASAAGVAIENARLYEQLRQATEEFQRRLLPEMPRLDGLELHARYQPSTEVPRIGGDWYDFIHLPDRVPCLLLGDVMGHGIPAATVMSQISNMLRVIAFDEQEPPSRILHRLDLVLHELHGGPMATVVVARLEPEGAGRRLQWASAGHLPPLLVTPEHRARYLHADIGPPLGVDLAVLRPDHEEHLPPGSALVLHTDGLVEQRGECLGAGMDKAAGVAAAYADRPLPDLVDALVQARSGTFEDDVALLAARITPTAEELG
ncbi:PP2C family protein-serine/threonine phosphatase [Streptomyces cavernicola]|uniref:SpoIIE family protein phosphatase n=1 Tax=Streptomyces cavernicola TaxID=3043613 RepID=A0ABT6SBE0_9ACTN|nr:GAF domain-containing SpoIIE family protein phosphatase [Streptomyces sp. B-S-A6]MDI3405270.1 SpoIIE family protein phosphatase [Streptomyces sp. B-S-A6]